MYNFGIKFPQSTLRPLFVHFTYIPPTWRHVFMFNSTMSLHLVYTSYDRVTKQHCVVAHRERERERAMS